MPSRSIRMFSGFTSRWTTPLRWAACSALGDLGEHRRGAIGRQRPVGERVGEAAGVDQAHHEVRGTRLAPVVVQRDDVRVLEPGDELGLGLEPADERRVVGELGPDHLDRHLAPDDRLVGAEDRAEGAASELLAQLVAAHRQPRPRTQRPRRCRAATSRSAVVDEDLRARGRASPATARPRPRRRAAAGTRRTREAPRRRGRIGTAPASATSTKRSRSGCWRTRLCSSETSSPGQPEPQVGVDPVLDRLQAELLEPGDLGLGPRLVGELLVGVTAPHGRARPAAPATRRPDRSRP